MIALDTTTIIDLFKGNPQLGRNLKTQKPLCSTQLNYLELMLGLDSSKSKHQQEEQYYDELFKVLTLLELDTKASKKAGEIRQQLRKQGKEVGGMDCAIAGILLTQGVTTIITKNKKHYENIPGLKVITY